MSKQKLVSACKTFVLVIIITGLALSNLTWADDPFGDDPFGADPLAGGAADPFADPTIDAEERERQRRIAKARDREDILCEIPIIRETAYQLAEKMAMERDDAWCLEGSLVLLHDAWHHGGTFDEFIGHLEVLAGHTWRMLPEETPETMLLRIQREFTFDRHPTVQRYRRLVDFERKRFDGPRMLDWRAEQELWLGVVATMVRSHGVENPAPLWRAKMELNPKHQRLYRYCYVALARQQRLRKLDFDLIKPMLAKHQTGSLVDLAWQARVLHTYAACRIVAVDHPERVAVRELFLKNLRSTKLNRAALVGNYHHLHAIGQMYNVARFERRQILDAFSKAGLEALRVFSRMVGVPDSELRDLLLARKTTLDFDDTPLRDAIKLLESKTLLPLMVDDSIRADAKPMSLQMTGTWLDLTETLLEKTEYRFEPLGSSMFWIGKPENAKRWRELLVRNQEKAAFANKRVAAALHEPTLLGFIETPLIDVCDYLEDLTAAQIELFGDVGDRPVTRKADGLPLHFALDLICSDVNVQWNTFDQVIIVAPAEEMKKLDALKRVSFRRRAKLRSDTGKVAQALQENAHIEFIATPVTDVADYLSDYHEVPVRLADKAVATKPVTVDLKGITTELALDLMTFKLNLAWYAEGEEIVIGSDKAIQALRAKTEMD